MTFYFEILFTKFADLCVRHWRQGLLSLGVESGQGQQRGHTERHSTDKTELCRTR